MPMTTTFAHAETEMLALAINEWDVVRLGAVAYSVDDPDDAWIEAPVDYSPTLISEALDACRLAGMEMIPLDEAGPEFMPDGRIRYYLTEIHL